MIYGLALLVLTIFSILNAKVKREPGIQRAYANRPFIALPLLWIAYLIFLFKYLGLL